MLGINDIVVKSDDQMETDLGTETLMMRVETGMYYSVDGTSRAIWTAIDGPTRVSDIVDALLQRYDIDRETCTAQALSFLNDLQAQGLISRLPGTGR